MEFNHRVFGIDQVGPVHLDFVEKRSVRKIVPHRCHGKLVNHWPVNT